MRVCRPESSCLTAPTSLCRFPPRQGIPGNPASQSIDYESHDSLRELPFPLFGGARRGCKMENQEWLRSTWVSLRETHKRQIPGPLDQVFFCPSASSARLHDGSEYLWNRNGHSAAGQGSARPCK